MKNSGGVLEINEEGYNKLLDDQLEQINKLTNARMIEQFELNDAQNKATQEELFYENSANGKIQGTGPTGMAFRNDFDNLVSDLSEIYENNQADFAYTSTAFKQALQENNLEINDEDLLKNIQKLIESISKNSEAIASLTDSYGGVTEADEEFINTLGTQYYRLKYGKEENTYSEDGYITGTQITAETFTNLIKQGNEDATSWLASTLGEDYVNKKVEDVKVEDGKLQAKINGEWLATAYESAEAARDAFETTMGAELWYF